MRRSDGTKGLEHRGWAKRIDSTRAVAGLSCQEADVRHGCGGGGVGLEAREQLGLDCVSLRTLSKLGWSKFFCLT